MYQEETTFNLRFNLEAKFPETYDGDDDDMVWAREWETQVKPEIVKAIFQTLRQFPHWSAHVRNRGMAQTDEIEVALVKDYSESTL